MVTTGTGERVSLLVGAYSDSDGMFGVAVSPSGGTVIGGYLVIEMTADEMVEMAEHLLVNARRLRRKVQNGGGTDG